MTTRTERFDASAGAEVFVKVPAGEVRVVRGDPGAIVVTVSGSDQSVDRFLVERRGGVIVVEPDQSAGWRGRWASVRVLIEAGVAPTLTARLASGDLDAEVDLASLTVDTAAGDVRVDGVGGDVTLKSASGDVRLGPVGGRLQATLASGDLHAVSVNGGVRAHSASGDVRIERAGDDVTAKTASGDLAVELFEGRSFDAKTLSGDVVVGVPAGRGYDVSLQAVSGSVDTAFAVSEGGRAGDGRLRIVTVSGDITIRAAG